MPHLAAHPTAPSITTLAPIHDTREPVSTAAPNLWGRIAIACRVKHYSLSTERTYIAWARKFVAWSGRRHPRTMGAAEVEAYLTHLAVDQGVSTTQIYTHVVKRVGGRGAVSPLDRLVAS